MSAIGIVLLFGVAFALSVWTLCTSIRPHLHRFRELLGSGATPALPPQTPSRITVRWSQPRPGAATPLRAAA